MASFSWALEQMKAGKRVKRKIDTAWVALDGITLFISRHGIVARCSFEYEAIIADDWELAE